MGWMNRIAAVLVAATGIVLSAFGQPDLKIVEATRIPRAAPTPDRVATANDAAERLTVPVRLNGSGPYPFVIDTGADRTVVSRELAQTLGLQAGEPVLLNGTGGVDLTPTARIDHLAVGARELHDLSAATLAANDLGAAGLLGIDSLRDQRMVMDFRRHTMSVEPSRRRSYASDVIVVRARSRYGELVLVDAAVNGVPLAVIVDSGAQNTIGNLALQRLVTGRNASALTQSVRVLSAPAQFADLPHVRVGGAVLNNVPIAFADLHTFAEFDMNGAPAMLLGMDVLRHFDKVVVDFGRKEVSFQVPLEG